MAQPSVKLILLFSLISEKCDVTPTDFDDIFVICAIKPIDNEKIYHDKRSKFEI